MTTLKKGNHPILKNLPKGERWISAKLITPVIKDGQKFCAWCAEVPSYNKKYCSIDCENSCYIHCSPQSNAGLAYLLERDGCFCHSCGLDWSDELNKARVEVIKESKSHLASVDQFNFTSPLKKEEFIAQCEKVLNNLENNGITWWVVQNFKRSLSPEIIPEIDHIVPVALGGETFGFDNLQILCKLCHKSKTQSDLIKIKSSKK